MIQVTIFTAPWCTKCKESSFVNLLQNANINAPKNTTFEYINEGDDDFPEDIVKIPTVRIAKDDTILHEYEGVQEITDSLEMDLATVLA